MNKSEIIIENDDQKLDTARPIRKAVMDPVAMGSQYEPILKGADGVMLPDHLNREAYDKLMKEKSGEVKTYNVGRECVERYKKYTRECKKKKINPLSLKEFSDKETR